MMSFSVRRQRVVLLVGIMSFIGFLAMVILYYSGIFTIMDTRVSVQVQSLWNPEAIFWMKVVTTIGQPLVLAGIATLSGVVMLLYRRWSDAVLLLVGLTAGSLLILPIKDLVHRPRPPDALVSGTGLSFPSEHAAVALLFFAILLVFVFRARLVKKVQWLITGLSMAVVLLISFSRVYLDVHWLSDIIGGWLFGLWWFTVTLLLAYAVQKVERERKGEGRPTTRV
jgi:membrane-associated phospholipid phosphatase